MSNLRDATKTLHDRLESLPFNKRMFEGNQTNAERATYLCSNLEIFEVLDPHVPVNMRRSSLIEEDIGKLNEAFADAPQTTFAYRTYLEKVCDDLRPHIYLNYMGFMFGGQIMKKRYPQAASMYEFDDIEAQREYIRQRICESYNSPHWNTFVSEVKVGFKWHIGISKELGEYFNVG
jgi:hypothetical protein